MCGMVLRTGDDAGLVESGQAHGLGFVKLWILKRGKAQQSIAQVWRKISFDYV